MNELSACPAQHAEAVETQTRFSLKSLERLPIPLQSQHFNMGNTILRKPVHFVDTTVFNERSGFVHKRLCGGPTFSAGTACAYSCTYCYVEQMVLKQQAVRDILRETGLRFDQIVIRRNAPVQQLAEALTRRGAESSKPDAESLLTQQIVEKWGLLGKHSLQGRFPRFQGPEFEQTVVFGSPLVDVAATKELAEETVDVCELILRLTSFQLRLLSKSPLLESIVANELHRRLPDTKTGAKQRVIFGLSTGTLDDAVAEAIEVHTPSPSKRLEALHRLQDNSFRTYGMLCPILPQADPVVYATEAMSAIRAERCEEIWAEPVNFRTGAQNGDDETQQNGQRDSFQATVTALTKAGLNADASRLRKITEDKAAWELYCRDTFEALIASSKGRTKLWWMQYPRDQGVIPSYWENKTSDGALLLGAQVSIYRCKPFLLRKEEVDISGLLSKLFNPETSRDPILTFVLTCFSKETRLTLEEGPATFSETTDPAVGRALLAGLNQFVKKPLKMKDGKCHSWYKQLADLGVQPSKEATALNVDEEHLTDYDMVRLNRILIHDAFPDLITAFTPPPQNPLEGVNTSKPSHFKVLPPVFLPHISTPIERFNACEEVVKRGWLTFIDVGRALLTIRDEDLYKQAGYERFEDYCQERLEWTRSTANRHIWAAEVQTILEPIGAKPTNESQVRFLNGIAPEQVRKTWLEAQELAGKDPITAKLIRKVASKFKPATPSKEKHTPKGSESDQVSSLIDEVAKAAKNGDTATVLKLLGDLRKMVAKE
jgi:DNA repair photolyase